MTALLNCLKWAYRDLKNSPRFLTYFVLNAALGLAGVLAIQNVDQALTAKVQLQSGQILGADLAISARRFLADAELQQLQSLIPKEVKSHRLWEFFSMATVRDSSQLVFIKAIEDAYPLYGKIELGKGRLGSGKELLSVNSIPGVWVPNEFLIQNDLKVDDVIKIGNQDFQIRETIFYDTSQGLRFSAMAQRLYASRLEVEKTDLFTKGTTFTETYSYAWSGGATADEVSDRFFRINNDPTLSVRTLTGAKRDFARPLQYLSDYLGLISVAALSLGFVGMSYLVRSFLVDRKNTIALWKCLGMGRSTILGIFLTQFVIIGALASLIAGLIGRVLVEFIAAVLDRLAPGSLVLEFRWQNLAFAFGVVLISVLAAAVPPMLHIINARVNRILNSEFMFKPGLAQLWMVLPLLLVLFGISLWFSNSYRIGVGFMLALMLILFIFSLLSWITLKWLAPRKLSNWQWHQIMSYLSRNWLIVTVHLVALGLGALLLGVFPHLKKGVEERFARPDEMKIPALFLFDIQDEQLAKLKELVETSGQTFSQLSPLVRARIIAQNGESYERPMNENAALTREEEEESRFRNRGVNLSYREGLAEGDEIVEGLPFSGPYSGKGSFEISVEERYAERMKMKLGDVLKFDVQGVEFEGKIHQIRSVNWTQFQPNFFIALQPGVVDEAPKTWLAGVPRLTEDQKRDLIKKLAVQFPNVSAIDVKETVKRVIQTSDQMLESVNLMFVLLFLVGTMVLFTVLQSQGGRRVWDMNLLRVLGAQRKDIRSLLSKEFLIVGFFSAGVSSSLAVLIANFVGEKFFEGMSAFSLSGFLLTIFIVTGLCWSIGLWVSRSIYNQSVQALLRGEIR